MIPNMGSLLHASSGLVQMPSTVTFIRVEWPQLIAQQEIQIPREPVILEDSLDRFLTRRCPSKHEGDGQGAK